MRKSRCQLRSAHAEQGSSFGPVIRIAQEPTRDLALLFYSRKKNHPRKSLTKEENRDYQSGL